MFVGCSNPTPRQEVAAPPVDPEAVRRNAATEHCAGITDAEKRKRDPLCLYLDCPGYRWDLYESAAAKRASVGMNVCLLQAAWGHPSDASRTSTAKGDTYVFTFDDRRRVMFGTTGLVEVVSE